MSATVSLYVGHLIPWLIRTTLKLYQNEWSNASLMMLCYLIYMLTIYIYDVFLFISSLRILHKVFGYIHSFVTQIYRVSIFKPIASTLCSSVAYSLYLYLFVGPLCYSPPLAIRGFLDECGGVHWSMGIISHQESTLLFCLNIIDATWLCSIYFLMLHTLHC